MKLAKLMTAAVAVGAAILPAGSSWGHDHGHHSAPAAVPATPQAKAVKLSDTVLTDQDGRQVRLLSDVVADKVVVVSFLFTNCTDSCPVVSHTFSQLQDKLGDALESRVRLVSLTVDPARDTPSTLKAYSAQHGARPGWLWLTGPSANVTEALKGFGVYSANFERHPMVVLIGDGRSGKWTRFWDIDDAQRLIAKTNEYLAAKGRDKLASAEAEQTSRPVARTLP
jgi:protein SCO1/2